MADSSKSFPPSEIKLERLRQQGSLPFSFHVMFVVSFLGLFIAMWYLRNHVAAASIIDVKNNLFDAAFRSPVRPQEVFAAAADLLWGLLLVLVVPVLFLVAVAGGIQTRFLFSLDAIKLDLGRVFSFGSNLIAFREKLAYAAASFVAIVAWFGVAGLLLYYLFSEIVADASIASIGEIAWSDAEGPRELIASAVLLLWDGGMVFCGGLFAYGIFIAIPSRFLEVLQFNRQNQMSRSEIEAEYREFEIAPELVQARRGASASEEETEES